ncbi:hypothetical protein AVEN_270988-1 [Araneus ventricosus]|uniref:Uncharacterized protein n=1 Tax=Araneus ventricosus TaxID=182803 RepID=A0A4Y2DMC8_ARAVE|nr:hypothetical protein AVEN_270988-1 [Araneus ventricosus]
MFIPKLKEVFEVVLKNERSTLMSRNKLRYILFTLNLFATVPCESPHALSIRFHRAPESIPTAFGISRVFYRIPRNPNRGHPQLVQIPGVLLHNGLFRIFVIQDSPFILVSQESAVVDLI